MKPNKQKSTSGGSAFYSRVDLSKTLFVFDLDNTLLTSQKTISNEIKMAIKALKAQGADVTIATGRAYELTKPFAIEIGATQPLILNNGALIKNHHDNHIVYGKQLSKDVIRDFHALACNHHFPYALHTESGFYINAIKSTAYYDEWNQLYPSSQVPYYIEEDGEKLVDVLPYKFLIIIENASIFEAMRHAYSDRNDCTITKSHTSLFDITPVKTNKGEALKTLIKNTNHKWSHVVAFGDNDNDSEMLEEAEIGIAMNNASKPCLAAADVITDATSDHGGVYPILKRFLENR